MSSLCYCGLPILEEMQVSIYFCDGVELVHLAGIFGRVDRGWGSGGWCCGSGGIGLLTGVRGGLRGCGIRTGFGPYGQIKGIQSGLS